MSKLNEQIARRFHDTYERLAPDYGYETRADTKEFDPTSPNGKLMIAVCNEVVASSIQEIMPEKRSLQIGMVVHPENALWNACISQMEQNAKELGL